MTIARNRILCLALIAMLAQPTSALHAATSAQGFGFISPKSDAPISIEADNGIEWSRKDNVYIARGNAKAQSGDVTVEADELRGYYRDGQSASPVPSNTTDIAAGLTPGGKFELYKLEAIGNVRIHSGASVLTSERAFYDLDQMVFVAEGKSIELQSDKTKLTAGEKIEYWQNKNLAVARGGATAIQDKSRLQADIITAHFNGNGKDDKMAIDRIDASGNVKIQSGDNLAAASSATYDLGSGQATMKGAVKLTQGPNQLNGDYAEMNTKTGISRILSNKDKGQGMGRVRALVIPDAAKKTSSY